MAQREPIYKCETGTCNSWADVGFYADHHMYRLDQPLPEKGIILSDNDSFFFVHRFLKNFRWFQSVTSEFIRIS